MEARIYRPAKPATSAGRAKTNFWVVEFEPRSRKRPDRLIGWVGSDDTAQQVEMRFPTKEAAVAYCERMGISYHLQVPQERIVRPKSYAENFIKRV